MAESSLMRTGETPPTVGKGHGTADLGPTDSTDSGSDVRGGHGFRDDERLGKLPGSNSDSEDLREGAGPDLGDRDLDSDSDRSGTGERASAGRDEAGPIDQTLYDDEGNAVEGEDIADDSSLDTTLLEADDAPVSRTDRTRGRGRRDAGGDVERADVPASDRSERDPSV
jgi:hypothetical protein